MNFKDCKVRKSLQKKGFVNEPNKHHNYFYLYVDGKRTQINTHTSRNGQDIDDFLINKMSKQVKLERKEFMDLINCPLSKEEYIKILRERNYLD